MIATHFALQLASPGTFHRPAHGVGTKRVAERAEMRLSGQMTGEQNLGEGLAELPLGAYRTKTKP
jgi:hypothetical protein